MSPELLKLLELRKEHPFVSYFIIIILLTSVVLGLLTASQGFWVPLLIGIALLIFFALLLVVFARITRDKSSRSVSIIGNILLWFVAIIFMVWIVLFSLAILGIICLHFITEDCSRKPLYEISGNISPIYNVKSITSASESLDHRRSSCRGRSTGVLKTCLPVGYKAKSAIVQGLKVKNNNGGTSVPKLDSQDDRCFSVDWNAASGGRTGIGECRYHGNIKFSLEVSGEKIEEKKGKKEIFNKSVDSFNFEEFFYPSELPQNTVEAKWSYTVTVKRNFQWFGFVKGWSETASSDKRITKCLKTSITNGDLSVENLCT